MDNELKGEGNSLNYTFRMHDPRVGRFFAIDPLADEYPYYSTYAFSENRVIDANEVEGLEIGRALPPIGWSYILRKNAENTTKIQIAYDDQNEVSAGQQVWRQLYHTELDILGDIAQFTDIDDAVIIGTTIAPGETGPVDVKGNRASGLDQTFAFGGAIVPFVSGSIIKRLLKGDNVLRGQVEISQEAIEYASKNTSELKRFKALKATANELADRGVNVVVKGEGLEGTGELTLKVLGKEIATESKRLTENTARAVQTALSKGTKQVGDRGVLVIDGTGAGISPETFKKGFESFINSSVKNRKKAGDSGTTGKVIFLHGDGATDVIKF